MKKKLLPLSLAVSSLIISMSACSDDDSSTSVTPAAPSQTNTELITEKNFVVTDYLLTVDGTTDETFADFDDCDKDDFTRFEKNGTAVDNEGATKCDPSDPQTVTYAWLFASNETKLELDYGMGNKEIFNILRNDGTTLKLDITEVTDWTGDGNDNSIIATITLTKQ